jgi:hypothetical protein
MTSPLPVHETKLSTTMKSYLIIALSCLASILLSSCSKPENKLVSHIESVDKIMRDNIRAISSERGVRGYSALDEADDESCGA